MHRIAFCAVLCLGAGLASCVRSPQQPTDFAVDPSPASRSPPSWLVMRAWAGREPLTTSRAWAAVIFAWQQVGKPYCWGGTGPGCFDCSGLVQSAWASVGVALPRTANAIASRLDEVPLQDVRSGDVLWWPGHVGLYAGYGWVIEALDARDGVVRRPAKKNPYRAFRPNDEVAHSSSRAGLSNQNWP
jgi:cell wall-associated NlpC family hydrolase